jgi:macrodomain Ter protein organizer (MatP/YcbG family)
MDEPNVDCLYIEVMSVYMTLKIDNEPCRVETWVEEHFFKSSLHVFQSLALAELGARMFFIWNVNPMLK